MPSARLCSPAQRQQAFCCIPTRPRNSVKLHKLIGSCLDQEGASKLSVTVALGSCLDHRECVVYVLPAACGILFDTAGELETGFLKCLSRCIANLINMGTCTKLHRFMSLPTLVSLTHSLFAGAMIWLCTNDEGSSGNEVQEIRI